METKVTHAELRDIKGFLNDAIDLLSLALFSVEASEEDKMLDLVELEIQAKSAKYVLDKLIHGL